MYTEFLRQRGLVPIPSSTASDALAVAATADVIVTGVLLPGQMDGIEFLAQLKADDHTKNVPIIVLTSCGWQSDRERATKAGCDVFLTKPCLPEDLLKKVRRVLALRNVPKPQPASVSATTYAALPSHVVN
jgi:two-component system, cell cycle response regulator DivK